jgi:hypothetical protein
VLDGRTVGSANPLTVLMSSNHTLQAVYTSTWQLSVKASAGGSTLPKSGNYIYVNGTSVQITATPSLYYQLDHWLLDGVNVGKKNPLTVLMYGSHTVQPVFVQISYYLTVLSSANGKTSPAPGIFNITAGNYVFVTAFPYTGFKLDHWLLDSKNAGNSTNMTLFMAGNHTLQAIFSPSGSLTGKATTAETPLSLPINYAHPDSSSEVIYTRFRSEFATEV